MKKFMLLTLAVAVLMAGAALGADFAVKTYKASPAEQAFKAALDTARTPGAQVQIARQYRDQHPDDIAVQLRVAKLLARDNLDSTRAYYIARAEREPGSEIAQYLAGWLAATPADREPYTQRLLQKNPNSYWGNLLQAGSYNKDSDPGLKQAEALLLKCIAEDNSLPYALEGLGQLYRSRNELEAADEVYQKLGRMMPDRFEPVYYRVALVQGDHRKAVELIDEFLQRNPDHVAALTTKARSQRELFDWTAHIETMRRLYALDGTGANAYDLACGYSLAGAPDSAFTYLFTAVDLGLSEMEMYRSDEDLVPLRDDPRWSELLAKIEVAAQAKAAEQARQAAATAPQRRETALASRQDLPAPDFTLEDLNGKSITLSKLKGKIVVLDFWATWCGPCKMTMPLLDKYYADKPDDVLLYGVNVMERGGTEKVKPFIEEKGFKFPILYGTSDMPAAWGIRGIPTLVVIDKQGKIAYRHIGYDPNMIEVLNWQVEELRK